MNEHSPETAAGRLEATHCRFLCTKTMFTARQDLPPEPEEFHSDTAAWWCELTQTCFGPDDQLVEPSSCHGGRRPCHEDRLPPRA